MYKNKLLLLIFSLVSLSSCNISNNNSSDINTDSLDSSIEESSSIIEESSSIEQSSSEEDSSIDDSFSDNLSSSEDTILADGWTNSDYGTYYENININSSSLLKDLQTLNKNKRLKTVGYSNMWTYFSQTDYDPADNNKTLAYYTNTSAVKSGNNMNKEHVWPKSRGGNLVEADIHTIRPTLTADNSSRGNSFYVEGSNSSSNGWDPNAAGLVARYRGDAARIIFYCVVAESSLKLVDLTNDATSNKSMGKLSDLLKWNLQYPVSQSELNRNNGAEDVQGNRNPFIDNPSYACAIWGDTNDSTKSICAGKYNPSEDTSTSDTPSVEPDDNYDTSGNYTLVTSLSQLSDNDEIVIACNTLGVVASSLSGAYLASSSATFSDDKSKITSLPEDATLFKINKVNDYYTLTTQDLLLGCSAVKKLVYNSGVTSWNITITDGYAMIESTTSSYGTIYYNSSHPKFTTYTSSGQNKVQIYKKIQS